MHQAYAPGAYDNWAVWAGAMSVDIDGLRFEATLARAFLGDGPPPAARARCEVFVAAVEAGSVEAGDLEARLWTDAAVDAGRCLPMRLRTDAAGRAQPCGANLVFESQPFPLTRTGAFAYTVELRAGAAPADAWVAVNDMADNRDGVIVVSPAWVAAGPTLAEVCVRKVGARVEAGRFRSGRFQHLTEGLDEVPTDVVYLLPFFKPGFGDRYTGKDVRKGQLGSVYAVADFFQVDPELVTPVAEADLAALVADGSITDDDVRDVWSRVPAPGTPGAATGSAPTAGDLAALGGAAAAARFGGERLTQLLGRAELRQLTGRAHELGKRVIFDLVLMQTSRDANLVATHPEWFVRDAEGRPQIHRIAWLVYSDVALFDLVFNEPLQDYLLEVAPYWMERCGLDGVRIDASQTVDRPFLKRLKNRIQGVDPQALVLGETLCPLSEAVDIPVDMIYALMVDFHRDAERATPLVDFLEEVHGTFAAGTVAMAYFENHDSPRATQVWRQRYAARLRDDGGLAAAWRTRVAAAPAAPPELWMALLKNLQATLIDATAGMAPVAGPARPADEREAPARGTRLAWAIEWGSDWGEESPTDFENPGLLHPEQRTQAPRSRLVAAYRQLAAEAPGWGPWRHGRVYYHRNVESDDRVLACTRYTEDTALVVVHNLDATRTCRVRIDLRWLGWPLSPPELLFDTYHRLGLPAAAPARIAGTGLELEVAPLQTRLWHLGAVASRPVTSRPATSRKEP